MIDITGRKFGKLTVLKFYSKIGNAYHWQCICECGNITVVSRSNLNKAKGCGCLITTNTHPQKANTKLNNVYYNMRKRCLNSKSKSYVDYGGRGIKICNAWMTYEGFLNDMAHTYKEGLSLDRIDVNGNYCKENCRWVDKKTQANNTRTNRFFYHNGVKYTLTTLSEHLSEKYNINKSIIYSRLSNGKSIEESIVPLNYEEITYKGETKTVSEFAKEYNMTYYQLKKRLMRGWSVKRAIEQPIRHKVNNKYIYFNKKDYE